MNTKYTPGPWEPIMYLITATERDDTERAVHFEPNTLEACAGMMEAVSCGTRKHAKHYLTGRGGVPTSYTAINSRGTFYTARLVRRAS